MNKKTLKMLKDDSAIICKFTYYYSILSSLDAKCMIA